MVLFILSVTIQIPLKVEVCLLGLLDPLAPRPASRTLWFIAFIMHAKLLYFCGNPPQHHQLISGNVWSI